jgi:Leucine-rich repeat (LRR) protein
MSRRLKLILALLFIIQIGVITWSYYGKIWAEEERYAPYQTYLENPLAVTTMDLSGLGIDELILEMVQFQNVEILNLSNNRFEEIPAIIYQLPKLKVLNLSKNRIKRFQFLKNITIENLDLSDNKLTNVRYAKEGIGSWKGLKWINLSNNQLTESPNFNDIRLDTILMANNELSSFDDIRMSMPNEHIVEYLDISRNPIEGIVYEFSYDYSDLKNLADKCYALNISKIRYERFPYEIFSYNTDKTLETILEDILSEGEISNITMSDEPHNLHTLNISNSIFSEQAIQLQTSDLKNLNLSNLNLVFTVEMFQNFPELETLYLENANFESFDFKHETLTKLYMNGLKCGAIFKLTVPKLKLLEINYDSAELLLNSELPNIQTIKIYDYQKEDVEIIKKLKNNFPNVTIEYR